MNEDNIDRDMLVKNSLEYRRYAHHADTADERVQWIKMADELLARAQDFEEE